MDLLLKKYQNIGIIKDKLEAANKYMLDSIYMRIDVLIGREKSVVRELDVTKLCIHLDPEFKDWLEDKFYKYEGGNIDAEDLSAYGSSVLRVLGYDESYYETTNTTRRIAANEEKN